MAIDKEKITTLTEEYGGQWGINHTRRLLALISLIDEGQQYDHEALWLACCLHDWGAYKKWAEEGVDHAVRSRQVAEGFLTAAGVDLEQKELILECIGYHHSATKERRIEAILLFDADILDFLGPVGVMRDISKNTKDLRKGMEISKGRMEKLPGKLILERSKEIAKERLPKMRELFEEFEKETFGYY